MSNAPDHIEPRLKLANRIVTIGFSATTASSAWIVYLYDPRLNQEPELRNKIFCILVTAFLDTAEQYQNRISGLKAECRAMGLGIGLYYLDRFAEWLALLVEFLSVYSKKEFVQIAGLRDQWLHGHWSEILKGKRNIRYIDKGIVLRESVSFADYVDLFDEKTHNSVDSLLENLRDRFCNTRTFFWSITNVLGHESIKSQIYYDLHSSQSDDPSVELVIPPPSFKPCRGGPEHNDAFGSLFELTLDAPIGGRREDPVVRRGPAPIA